MKDRSKVGNRSGNPAYRTPATFRSIKQFQVTKTKALNPSKGRFKNHK